MPDPRDTLQQATGIGPGPPLSLQAFLQSRYPAKPGKPPPAPPQEPRLRAATTTERISDWLRSVYEQAAAHPLGKVADLIGLSDLAGMVHSFEEAPEVMAGVAAPGPKPTGEGRGLYSRVDEAVNLVPKKGAHPNKIASILKSNAPAEEVALRKVPEFLASKGNATVTPAELSAHLAAHPAPIPAVKTLGGTTAWSPELERAWNNGEFGRLGSRPSTPQDWTEASGRLERLAQQWQRNGDRAKAEKYFRLSEEATTLAEGLDLGRGLPAGQPKYASYQVPGGENYRETLLTLPPEMKKQGRYKVEIRKPTGEVTYSGTDIGGTDVERLRQQYEPNYTVHFEEIETPSEGFRAGHWDEPNIVVHTRANERTLPTGERGRFIEEVQSDWHQKGKKEGYGSRDVTLDTSRWTAHENNGQWRVYDEDGGAVGRVFVADPGAGGARTPEEAIATVARNVGVTKRTPGVPDAPFKETWQDLGLKQQVLEAAADPNAQWIGHTTGATQAARYDLSKQVDGIVWHKNKDGTIALSAQKDGRDVFGKDVAPTALPDIIGKELAERIINDPRDYAEFSGVDLQVGGEGMRHFYDKVLPSRLQKILKPFGGTVERGSLATRTKAQIDAAMDALHAAPWTNDTVAEMNRLQTERNAAPEDAAMWFAKLTPEMKARILKEGLPLSVLLGLVPLSQLGQPRPEARQ